MARRAGIPRRLRLPILVLLLLVGHAALAEPLEKVRLLLFRPAVLPLTALGAGGSGRVPAPDPAELEWLAAGRAHVTGSAEERRRLLPVLDYDTRRGRLVVGGGREAGVRPGALVVRRGTCVGVVSRVERHLARVRLLHARGVALSVELEEPPPDLPGGLASLHGKVRGDGRSMRLVESFIPEAFRRGDALITRSEEGGRGLLVGTVEEAGVRPRVRPALDARGLTFVAVEGLDEPVGHDALFEERPFRLLLRSSGWVHGAVVRGAGAGGLQPGTAVHAAGVYLGAVTAAGFGAAHVSPADDPGRTLTVKVLPRGGAPRRAILRGDRAGGAGAESWAEGAPPDGPVLVVTAGGQELVPPWLVVGRGEVRDGRLEVRVPRSWPEDVLAACFRYVEERRRLLGRRGR